MTTVMPESRGSGLKRRRLPGKPSRFDPDQPLHMTTRRAAKGRAVEGSHSSFNSSVDGGESPRTSLDGMRPLSSHSADSQLSPSRLPCLTNDSVKVVGSINNKAHSRPDLQLIPASLDPPQPKLILTVTPSPTKKRKRSPSTLPIRSSIEQIDSITPSANRFDVSPVPIKQFLPHPEGASLDEAVRALQDDEEASKANVEARAMSPITRVAPLVSGMASPVSESSVSDSVSRAMPIPHHHVTKRLQDDGDHQTGMDDVDGINDLDDQPVTDEDGTAAKKRRLGGRRRAVHPLPHVEAAMRRQSELRTAYRNLARQQKTLLAEIASRTLNDLENDETAHTIVPEHFNLLDNLQKALDARRHKIQQDYECTKSLLDHDLQIGREVRELRHTRAITDVQEIYLGQLEHSILEVERSCTSSRKDSPHGTEDEDDVLPRLKSAQYRKSYGAALDSRYDSRSRVVLETETAMQKLNARLVMKKALAQLDPAEFDMDVPTFTIMDETRREAAITRRLVLQSMDTLTQAASHVEEVANMVPIANKDATGLVMLSDAAFRTRSGRTPQPARQTARSTALSKPSSHHKQFAASFQPSVQSLLSPDDTTTPSSPPPPIKVEAPSNIMSPPHLPSAQQMPQPSHLHRSSSFSMFPFLHPLADFPRLQPLRLHGYPHRPLDFAPGEDEHARKHFVGPWPELPPVTSHMNDRVSGRLPDPSSSPRFPNPTESPHDNPMGGQYGPGHSERAREDANPNTIDAPQTFFPGREAGNHTWLGPGRFSPQQRHDSSGPDGMNHSRPGQSGLTSASKPLTNVDATNHSVNARAHDKAPLFSKWKASRDDRSTRARKQPREILRDPARRHGHSLSSSGIGIAPKQAPPSATSPSTSLEVLGPLRRPSWEGPPTLGPHPSASGPAMFGPLPPPGFSSNGLLPPPISPYARTPVSLHPLGLDHGGPSHHRNSFSSLPPVGWSPHMSSGEMLHGPHHPLLWPMPPRPGFMPHEASLNGAHPFSVPQPASHTAPPAHAIVPPPTFGGPALAPAYEDPRRRPEGFGGPMPAFAQQQRNSEGARRRAQSEAHQPKIHQWTPAGSKRK